MWPSKSGNNGNMIVDFMSSSTSYQTLEKKCIAKYFQCFESSSKDFVVHYIV